MATYYVGTGGDNSNNGLSWENRKLTLNGAEDIPVAAGDIVYVGPGVYRELLTIDVSGSDGSPITYIADVTGEKTDGIGGTVRITGSDNDLTASRANCIAAANDRDYRTFRGFSMDTTSSYCVNLASDDSWIIEECSFQTITHGILLFGVGVNNIFRRCVFVCYGGILIQHTSVHNNSGHVIENCLFLHGSDPFGGSVQSIRVGGFTVKNCTMFGGGKAVYISTALDTGQTITVNNCLMIGTYTGIHATTIGEITEDYNLMYMGGGRTATSTGGNSVAYPVLFTLPILKEGFRFPWFFGELSQWSQARAATGNVPSASDLFGITKPTTEAKRSWGSIQFNDVSRSTVQTYDSSAASLVLSDAGSVQFHVPVTAASTTFAVRVYREADYAGTLPRMVIKQPGQSDTTVTDTAAAGQWNLLTTTLTPASVPGYVIIELQSLNTATSGSYKTYFDSILVS